MRRLAAVDAALAALAGGAQDAPAAALEALKAAGLYPAVDRALPQHERCGAAACCCLLGFSHSESEAVGPAVEPWKRRQLRHVKPLTLDGGAARRRCWRAGA